MSCYQNFKFFYYKYACRGGGKKGECIFLLLNVPLNSPVTFSSFLFNIRLELRQGTEK